MPNPYLAVHARQRARARGAPTWILALLSAALAAPLARPVLLGFLGGGALGAGVEAVALRAGAVLIGVLSLSTYSALVRGPDRAVLDPHPVQPRLLLMALVVRTAREQLWLVPAVALLLSPVLLAGSAVAWAGIVGVALGSWMAGLGLGFAGSLGGVWAATSPALARLLDLLRGANPRMQAALIYAPAVVLAVGGLGTVLAAAGLRAALEGYGLGWAWLGIPPALGLLGLMLALPLADRHYVSATAVLAEIDGAWGTLERQAEAREVYLEWTARGRVELLRALRQGWRRHRTWATGAWGLGLLGAFAGWTGTADAPDRALAVAGAAALVIAALPVRLAEGDPAWLDQALGVDPAAVGRARAASGWLYAQGAVLPAALALAVRHGLGPALPVLGLLEGLAALGAGVAALAAWRRGPAGVWLYGPAAILIWAATTNL